jgi:hypothetical protein
LGSAKQITALALLGEGPNNHPVEELAIVRAEKKDFTPRGPPENASRQSPPVLQSLPTQGEISETLFFITDDPFDEFIP